MLTRCVLWAALGLVLASPGPAASQVGERKFNVIGTWSTFTNWKALEIPFWTDQLPKASGGKLAGQIKSITELNLKGTDVLRLVKLGVYDFAAALPNYVDDGAAIIEAVDLAGVARSFKMSREITDLWMSEMQTVMKERHNAIILATFALPEQNLYCRGDVRSINDLRARKVRVQGTSQADIVRAFGGASTTIAFGEVVFALEKGVVDCAITGTMPAYKAKWAEVTSTLYRMPLGFTAALWVANLSTWSRLQPATRDVIQAEFKKLEDKSWRSVEAESEEGVACTTGQGGPCSLGPPARLKLVTPSESDVAAQAKALNDVVLRSWAKRCGPECAARWTEVIGKRYGLTARSD